MVECQIKMTGIALDSSKLALIFILNTKKNPRHGGNATVDSCAKLSYPFLPLLEAAECLQIVGTTKQCNW
eukprot:m.319889 g.319889  ORF g.319889 m.319889 type:complete len:70 (-) comp20308_c0_seq6:484-693(-)